MLMEARGGANYTDTVMQAKVTGWIPDSIIWIFYWSNPSCRTLALGLTQPVTEMRARIIFLGVKASCV